MNLTIDKYQKASSYSYIFGAFGTIELLKKKNDKALAIIVDPSFVNNEAFLLIKSLISQDKIIIDKKLISKIRDKGNIFVIGVFEKYDMELSTNKHLILNGSFDSGTIGTIIRSMNGFEYKDLVIINKDVDIFDEHLVRSSMGALFNVNVVVFNSMEEYINKYPDNKIYYITNQGNKINDYSLKDNYSLLFSNKKIQDNRFYPVNMNKDISLENIINIVLYNLY